jgi:hypothetical protein
VYFCTQNNNSTELVSKPLNKGSNNSNNSLYVKVWVIKIAADHITSHTSIIAPEVCCSPTILPISSGYACSISHMCSYGTKPWSLKDYPLVLTLLVCSRTVKFKLYSKLKYEPRKIYLVQLFTSYWPIFIFIIPLHHLLK